MHRKIIYLNILLVFIVGFLYSQQFTDLQGDYFGQTTPGNSAVIFAPGTVSIPDRSECRIVFSPDGNECFFNVWATDYSYAKIYYTKRENNVWTTPVEPSFSTGHMASSPFLSSDEKKLFFHYANYSGPEPYDIWMVRRTQDGWGTPEHLSPPINSNNKDGSYSETKDSIAYFASNRPGGFDSKSDIWRTYHAAGDTLQVENLGATVNSSAWDSAPCIAPDGSYLIFASERSGGHGYSDLYITFKKEDENWTSPVNMEINGAGINIAGGVSGDPILSPDGRFLFFSRSGDIYWVSAKIIEDIRNIVFPFELWSSLGQIPPDTIPVVFVPGIISIQGREHSAPSFSPDGKEVYWSIIRISNDSIYQHIMFMKYVDNAWTQPAIAPFSSQNNYEGGPVISPDGGKLYIYRGKPAPPGGDAKDINILCYSRRDSEWVNPVTIGEGVFHSVTGNGTIYYTGKNGLTRRVYKNDSYLAPEVLDQQINLPGSMNWTPFIARDESYLIFSRLFENGDYGNLYIAFHDTINDTWKEPISLGTQINTRSQERFPSISPDGKYLFFTRWISESNDDVFWVSSRYIDSLQQAIVNVGDNSTEKFLNFKLHQNYPNPFNPSTTVSYSLKRSSRIRLTIYNVLGQKVKTLVDSFKSIGAYTLTWDGTDGRGNPVSSGTYLYCLEADNWILQKKMLLIR